jgi:hypothetical protein
MAENLQADAHLAKELLVLDGEALLEGRVFGVTFVTDANAWRTGSVIRPALFPGYRIRSVDLVSVVVVFSSLWHEQ